MTSEFHNMTTSVLFTLLEQTVDHNAGSLERACRILAALKTRGERHEWMKKGAFRYFQEITDGRLSALAALTFDRTNILKKIVDYPIELQNKLAKGEFIDVYRIDERSAVVADKRTAVQLNARQIKLVFGKHHIRNVVEQEKLLRAEIPKTPALKLPRIIVDLQTNSLRVGKMKIEPHELIEPLRALGYQITRKS